METDYLSMCKNFYAATKIGHITERQICSLYFF